MHELFKYRSWAISRSYFNHHFPVITNALLNGHSLDHFIRKKSLEDFEPTLMALLSHQADQGVSITFSKDAASGMLVAKVGSKNIAVIPMIGPLTKYGDLCSMGMQGYQALLAQVNANPNIDATLYVADTPGGTVDGTPEFGLAIANSKKPVGFFTDNMLASAGYWLASQSDVIVGNKNNPTEVGSIGVLMAVPNYQNMMKAGQFPEVTIFRADQSTDKAQLNSIEPISDGAKADLQSGLNDTADSFIDTVKQGRGEKLDLTTKGLFTGAMFNVNDAKKAGLIDSVGTLQTALSKLAELARNGDKQKPSYQGTNSNANTMKFSKLSSLFGFGKSKEAKEFVMKMTNSEGLQSEDTASLEAAEKALADKETEVTQLKEANEQKQTKIASLEQNVTELQAQVKSIQEENTKAVASLNEKVASLEKENKEQKEKLEKKPTGQATTVIAKEEKESTVNGDPSEVKKKMDQYMTSVDETVAQIRKQKETSSQIK